jgi:hypothetical protein
LACGQLRLVFRSILAFDGRNRPLISGEGKMSTGIVVPAVPAGRASDDEILGLSTNTARKSGRNNAGKVVESTPANTVSPASVDAFFADLGGQRGAGGELTSDTDGDANEMRNSNGPADQEKLNGVLEANPELRDAWRDAQAYREVFATPAEAQAATKLLGDLNRMDALFYSQRPEDHAELARTVAQLDPQAFASLARAMSSLATSAAGPAKFPAATAPERDGVSTKNPEPATTPGLSAAQSKFFQATNAAAVQGVMEAIEAQVGRLLPEGIAKSARNRVAGEIYRELDATLQGNRALGQQMRDAFRSGALDDAHRRAIVSLVAGRARQALPGVAKRVLNEWTNTIVSANQDRRTRQRNAERRVDISGSSGGNDGRRAISSRDIDYGRMTDGDILNL